MARTVYYTATSLDGFIATPEHGLDWLLTHEAGSGGPLDYDTFIAGIGALCMGANTYEWVHRHSRNNAGEVVEPWGYEQPCWVFGHRELPPWPQADLRFTHAAIPEVHRDMVKVAAGKDVWIVGGGELAGQFHDHGLLDELIVSFAPEVLGRGQPLLPRRVRLKPLEFCPSGEFIGVRYAVVG